MRASGRRRRVHPAVLFGGAFLLIPFALAVPTRTGWAPLTSVDEHADLDAHQLVVDHRALLGLVRALTHLGDPLVVTVIAVALAVALFARGRRQEALYLLVVRAAAVIVGAAAKEIVRRARPVLAHPVAHAAGFSFPSGHALGSAALYGSLAVILSRRQRWPVWTVVAVAVPSVVATTRVMLGVHFPSDVVAGLALGWAIALLAAPVAWRPTRPEPGGQDGLCGYD